MFRRDPSAGKFVSLVDSRLDLLQRKSQLAIDNVVRYYEREMIRANYGIVFEKDKLKIITCFLSLILVPDEQKKDKSKEKEKEKDKPSLSLSSVLFVVYNCIPDIFIDEQLLNKEGEYLAKAFAPQGSQGRTGGTDQVSRGSTSVSNISGFGTGKDNQESMSLVSALSSLSVAIQQSLTNGGIIPGFKLIDSLSKRLSTGGDAIGMPLDSLLYTILTYYPVFLHKFIIPINPILLIWQDDPTPIQSYSSEHNFVRMRDLIIELYKTCPQMRLRKFGGLLMRFIKKNNCCFSGLNLGNIELDGEMGMNLSSIKTLNASELRLLNNSNSANSSVASFGVGGSSHSNNRNNVYSGGVNAIDKVPTEESIANAFRSSTATGTIRSNLYGADSGKTGGKSKQNKKGTKALKELFSTEISKMDKKQEKEKQKKKLGKGGKKVSTKDRAGATGSDGKAYLSSSRKAGRTPEEQECHKLIKQIELNKDEAIMDCDELGRTVSGQKEYTSFTTGDIQDNKKTIARILLSFLYANLTYKKGSVVNADLMLYLVITMLPNDVVMMLVVNKYITMDGMDGNDDSSEDITNYGEGISDRQGYTGGNGSRANGKSTRQNNGSAVMSDTRGGDGSIGKPRRRRASTTSETLFSGRVIKNLSKILLYENKKVIGAKDDCADGNNMAKIIEGIGEDGEEHVKPTFDMPPVVMLGKTISNVGLRSYHPSAMVDSHLYSSGERSNDGLRHKGGRKELRVPARKISAIEILINRSTSEALRSHIACVHFLLPGYYRRDLSDPNLCGLGMGGKRNSYWRSTIISSSKETANDGAIDSIQEYNPNDDYGCHAPVDSMNPEGKEGQEGTEIVRNDSENNDNEESFPKCESDPSDGSANESSVNVSLNLVRYEETLSWKDLAKPCGCCLCAQRDEKSVRVIDSPTDQALKCIVSSNGGRPASYNIVFPNTLFMSKKPIVTVKVSKHKDLVINIDHFAFLPCVAKAFHHCSVPNSGTANIVSGDQFGSFCVNGRLVLTIMSQCGREEEEAIRVDKSDYSVLVMSQPILTIRIMFNKG